MSKELKHVHLHTKSKIFFLQCTVNKKPKKSVMLSASGEIVDGNYCILSQVMIKGSTHKDGRQHQL